MKLSSYLLFGALLVGAVSDVAGQVPHIVYDINAGADNSLPLYLTPSGATLFFSAYTPAAGRELWQYQNGANVATMVADINHGTGDGTQLVSTLQGMANLGGNIYFPADDGVNGSELWVYTQNSAPHIEADINSGAGSSTPTGITNINNRLYMRATSANNGDELYVYNPGLPPVLYDINPGSASSYPSEFTEFNGKIYFAAESASAGLELFVFNPATSQVSVAADIAQGTNSSSPAGLVVLGNKLYFTANANGYGKELYSYDGTTATRLTDLAPGAASGISPSSILIAYNNSIYFSGGTSNGNYQLYKYSPASNAATLAATIYSGGNCQYRQPYLYKGRLYFSATNGTSGLEVWVHDGVNTMMVADLNPGAANGDPGGFQEFFDKLYFDASNGVTGHELYVLDAPNSVQSVAFDGSVQLSPNPAGDVAMLSLLLRSPIRCHVALYDMSGRVVWQQAENNYEAGTVSIAIPMKDMPAGNYVYQVATANGVMAGGVVSH